MNKIIQLFITLFLTLSFFLAGCAYARPPKPGPHFVWIPKHRGANGKIIPGHWKYTGPFYIPGKHWVPGHFNKYGVWVPGHWAKN